MLDKIDAFVRDPLAQKLLFFNEMLTPSLVRLAYWLCLLAVAWNGLGHMFSGGFGHFLGGIAYIVTGAILVRIAAELIMVLFKLNENMGIVAENTKTPPPPPPELDKPKRKTAKKTGKKVTKKVNKKA